MVEDFVRNNGYLSLGTRFKRIADRMQAGVTEVSAELGMPTAAGLLTALGAIEANGTLSVGRLAEALGVSQPAATKIATRLIANGLAVQTQDPADKRTSQLVATPEGAEMVRTGQSSFWPAVEEAVRDLCEQADGSLLDRLDAIEAGLSAVPLSERIRRTLKDRETRDDVR